MLCWPRSSWLVEFSLKRWKEEWAFLSFTFLQIFLNIVEPYWTLLNFVEHLDQLSWIWRDERKRGVHISSEPTSGYFRCTSNPNWKNNSFRSFKPDSQLFISWALQTNNDIFSCSWKLIATSASTLSSALLSQKGWSCSMGARWAVQSNYNLLWIIWI